jgi:hypothetical protein
LPAGVSCLRAEDDDDVYDMWGPLDPKSYDMWDPLTE